MMASPSTVNEAMQKADGLDSAHWLASRGTGSGFTDNQGKKKVYGGA